MGNIPVYLLVAFLVVNVLSFSIMLVDKIKSSAPGAERISEGMMFFLAAAFGSLGVYTGMFAFRHKTRKWYFLVGIPLLMAQNAATLFFIYQIFAGGVVTGQ